MINLMPMEETQKFLTEMYQFEDDSEAASFIMGHIFGLKESHDHEAIQDIMGWVEFEKFDSAQVIMTALRICAVRESFNEVHQLIVTGGEKTHLDNWDDFLQRGISRLKELKVEDMDRLLVGLI